MPVTTEDAIKIVFTLARAPTLAPAARLLPLKSTARAVQLSITVLPTTVGVPIFAKIPGPAFRLVHAIPVIQRQAQRVLRLIHALLLTEAAVRTALLRLQVLAHVHAISVTASMGTAKGAQLSISAHHQMVAVLIFANLLVQAQHRARAIQDIP